MNILTRIDKLQALLTTIGGNVKTRKRLHKLIYLLQYKGEDFDQRYRFHNFGVFSPTLAHDLELAAEGRIIEEEFDEEKGYVIKLREEASTEDIGAGLKPNSQRLARELVRRNPQELEALSTVVYLYQNYYRGPQLLEKLKELKPHLKKYHKWAIREAEHTFGVK